MPRVIKWEAPPTMDTGAPLPVIKFVVDSLFVTYVCHNPKFPGWDSGATIEHPGFDIYSAVLRFDRVAWHQFGAPDEHNINTHPLYSYGLRCHNFWEILDSPRKINNLRHWIGAFHDETLEVVAESSHIITEHHDGENTHDIILEYAK